MISPALIRMWGWLGFMFFGLFSFHLGNKIFGLNLNFWTSSWSQFGGKEIGLVVVSFIFAIVGMVIGWGIGTSIEVKNEKTDFIISSLWHYLASGTIVWIFLWTMYLSKTIGKENIKQFTQQLGSTFSISLLIIPFIGCLLIASLLLLIGLLNQRHKPILLACLIPSLPVSLIMSHIQVSLFRIEGYGWILIGILMPLILIPLSSLMITRDKFQRQQLKE